MIDFVQSFIPEEGSRDPVSETDFTKKEWQKTFVKVESVNNFPTAAGVASSSSGLACLAACLARLYGVIISEE